MRPHGRTSARLLSLVVATSMTASGRLARAEPDPPSSGALAALNQPFGEDPPPVPVEPTLREGARSASVDRAQFLLNEERARHGEGPIVEDGIFGPETLAAVKEFQHRHRLRASGVIDAPTWRLLEGFWPNGSGSTPGAPTSPAAAPDPGDPSAASTDPSSSSSAPSAPDTWRPASSSPASSSPISPASPAAASPLTAAVPPATNGSGGSGSAPSGAANPSDGGAAARIRDLATLDPKTKPTDATPKTAPDKKVTGKVTHLSAKELDTLSRLIESEAGVCSLENKIAVAAVVLNRARAGWANGTVTGVMQRGQFSGVHTASFRGKPSRDSILAAERAAAGEDPSQGATYYYNPYLAHPAWAKKMTQTVKIGTSAINTHRFMKP